MERITIIGVGLIGGSIGMALKRAKINGVEIVGHDKEPSATSKAHKRGAIDKAEWNLFNAVEGSSMVILATPVMAIKEVLEQIGPRLPDNCVVTDTGSTKSQVMRWAEEHLPAKISFVGGHPMAGKETPGIESADPDLFKEATYCILPGRGASTEAVKAVVGLVEILQAKPMFIDAPEHDSYVAAVSHLPIIMSAALVSSTSSSPSWKEMSRLAAGGYRDVSRLASGDPRMNRDICLTNQESILHWIDRLVGELLQYKQLMEASSEALEKTFVSVWEARERWLKKVDAPTAESKAFAQIPAASERMAGLFIGDRLARRSREIMDRQTKGDRK